MICPISSWNNYNFNLISSCDTLHSLESLESHGLCPSSNCTVCKPEKIKSLMLRLESAKMGVDLSCGSLGRTKCLTHGKLSVNVNTMMNQSLRGTLEKRCNVVNCKEL